MKATRRFPGRRRPVAIALGLLTMAAVATAPGCENPAPARPDILLVTIDTLRADHCSAYGYPVATTPVLAGLASGGVLYRRAYAESATTAPSHAVLMTGRHFRSLGVTKNGASVPNDAVTLAEALRDAGYATAGFVSSFPVMARFGFAQGFDAYDDAFVTEEASIGRRKPGETAHDRYAGATLAHFLRWLDARDDDRPLFAWVHFVDPHSPYKAPEKFDGAWPAETSGPRRRYDEEVRYADKQLGLLVDAFAARTPGREDFVIVTSDHGEGLGDHRWMSHGINLHEEAVRVPLVMRWPGRLPAGRVAEEPVALVDVAPTVLGLLGIDAPTFSDGVAVSGSLDPARAVFLQRRDYRSGKEGGRRIRGEMSAVVENGSKLIVAPEEKKRELYDLGVDPGETRDLLDAKQGASPGAEDSAAKLGKLLGRWHEEHPAAAASEAPVDDETLKALRSLGYVD